MNISALFLAAVFLNTNLTASERNPYRLSTEVKPSFYTIKLKPHLSQKLFSGTVTIEINVETKRNSIELHGADLNITKIFLDQLPVSHYIDYDHEIISIFLENQSEIYPGPHRIYAEYNGNILVEEVGFYKTQFTFNNTVVSELAVTDLQATHAKKVFPCFDEPAFKAKFKVTVIISNDSYIALSNMPLNSKFKTSTGTVYKFKTTPPMSTYLVIVAVTSYPYVEEVVKVRNKEISIRIYSYNVTNETSLAILKYVSQSLEFYTEYLDYENPLSKIDLISYDRNQSIATENWGLITTTKNYLRIKLLEDFEIVEVIAHELAHFWFGNLVTNYWWDHLWLQEAFAQYLSRKAADFILKKTNSLERMELSLEDVYLIDQRNDSTFVVTNLKSSSDIESHFNDIVYIKGAKILNMLEVVIGEDNFKKVLQKYIKHFAYGTAKTDDFLNIVDSLETDMDLRGFLESYLFQSRYPVISVEETAETYVLKQLNCTLLKNHQQNPYGCKWSIPITYITNLDPENYTMIWFDKDDDKLIVPKGNESWIKFNPKHVGYYQMNYSDKMWQKFLNYEQDIDDVEIQHLLLEAADLFHLDLVSCELPLQIAGKVKPFDIRSKYWRILSVHLNLENDLLKHDRKAYEIYKGYLNLIKSSYNSTSKYEKYEIPENKTVSNKVAEIVPDRVKKCSEWIISHLEDYIILGS